MNRDRKVEETSSPLLELTLLAVCFGGPWGALWLTGSIGGIVGAIVAVVLWFKYGPAASPGLTLGCLVILVLGNAVTVIAIALRTIFIAN